MEAARVSAAVRMATICSTWASASGKCRLKGSNANASPRGTMSAVAPSATMQACGLVNDHVAGCFVAS